MGTYCTTTSLDDLMVGTNFNNQVRTLAGICIGQAESEINKYLSKRYNVATFISTSTSTPPQVRTLCEWMSQALIYNQMGRGQELSDLNHNTLWEKGIKNLELLRDYKVDLVNTAGSAISSKSTANFRILSNTDTYSNTFDEDDVLNWTVDQDKIDDIDSGRD